MATIQCPHCSRLFALPSAPSDGRLKCPLCQQLFLAPTGAVTTATNPNPKVGDAFDPYYTWLGIPPRDQPPHHYRLLGLELFEANLDAIDNASSRQMAHLRTCSTGARATIAQDLLNKVAAARVCLLDATRKAEYDARLRDQIAASVPASVPALSTRLQSAPPAAVSTLASRPFKPVRSKKPPVDVLKIVLGGVVGLAIGYVVLLVFFPDVIGNRPTSAQGVPPTRSSRSAIDSKAPPSKSTTSTLRPALDKPPAAIGAGISSTPPLVAVENQPANHPGAAFPPRQSKPAEAAVSKKNNGKATGDSGFRPAESAGGASSLADLVKPPTRAPVASVEQFPSRVTLPPLDVTTWQTLVPLSKGPDRIELIPAFDLAAAPVSLTLEAAGTCDANRWWIKFEVTAAQPSASRPGNLAELQIEPSSEDLQFRWQSANQDAAAALSNSWLKFDLESQIRYLALRQPLVVTPLKLDFEKERFIVPLLVHSIPATDQLYLDLTPSTGLPGNAAFRNGMGYAQLDRDVVIEFSDMPGAQIAIKLAKVPQAPLGVIVEPRFKDGPAREFDLTFPQLEKTQRGATEAIQEAKGKIPGLTSKLSAAQSALKSTQGRSVKNAVEAGQKAIDINSLGKIIQDANRRLVVMREKEAAAQSRLNNVPKVLAFMRLLHGKEIPYRVVVKSSAAELTLAEGAIGGGAK